MKKISLLLFLAINLSVFGQISNESIDIDGTNRTYRQYLPSGITPGEEVKVLLVLHGIGDNSTNMSNIGFNLIADTARFIAIYPQGIANNFGQTSWNNGTLLGSTVDDIKLFRTILDSLDANYNINARKIFCTGFSMGGIMTNRVSCEMNGRIAAVASVAGPFAESDTANCDQTYKTPMMYWHGTADGTVPYSGSALPSLTLGEETVDYLRRRQGCDMTETVVTQPDNAADGITIDKITYGGCTTDFEFWRMNNADHIWPYQPANDVFAIFKIWEFFNRYEHNAPIQNTDEQELIQGIKIYPNPASNYITIEIDHSTFELNLFDVNGKLVLTQKNNKVINVDQFPNGIYQLKTSSNNISSTHKVIIQH